MLVTYKATLKGDLLQWQEENPIPALGAPPVKVLVTLLESPPVPDLSARGKRMREALQKLSHANTLTEISDPATWERELRQDRALPGREDNAY